MRAIRGRVFDVAVDLRANSATYGQWYGVELSEENKKQFYISPGFAHGFLVLLLNLGICVGVTLLSGETILKKQIIEEIRE